MPGAMLVVLTKQDFWSLALVGTELLANSSSQHSTLVLLEPLFDEVVPEPTQSL